MPVSGPRFDDFNSRVSPVVGVKKYQQIKKVMAEFDSKLKDEIQKQSPKIDHRIK